MYPCCISSDSTFEDNLEKLECVLKILSDEGLRVNAVKSDDRRIPICSEDDVDKR
jgi:hypothetical protein